MKLINHVLDIRRLIQQSFDNRFSRMGLKADAPVSADLLSEEAQKRRLRLENIMQSHLDELQGDYAAARQATINECVFTLFNRIAAIKVMESKELFPEIITRRKENAGRSFEHNAWLEDHPEERNAEREGLKHFLTDQFNQIGENIPLFKADYPYSLMPTADELNEIIDQFNAIEADPDCGENVWKGDDILGWLYENFNSVEKEVFDDSDEKTEYDKVSLQSQVYTPQWVVKFLVDNSLGKSYLEMFPDSQIKNKYKIANTPAKQVRAPKDIRTMKLLDPACGSGNFLIYAFTLFYDLYIDQMDNYGKEYSRRDIPKMIIENNLFGIDLDERAAQITQIALFIKAREIGGHRSHWPTYTNVVSTHFFLPQYSEIEGTFDILGSWDSKQREAIPKIWCDLTNAYKFGSLIRVEERLNELLPDDVNHSMFCEEEMQNLFNFKNNITTQLRNQVNNWSGQGSNPYTLAKANDAISFLEIISHKYDIVVANPPYTDSSDFGPELKNFIEDNYKSPIRFNQNLYSSFIKRSVELTSIDGKIGLIHPYTFMFNKTYDTVRDYLINNVHIDLMVDFGLDRVNLFGPGILVKATFYILSKGSDLAEEGTYFNLRDDIQEKYKKSTLEEAYNCVCNKENHPRVFNVIQNKFMLIESHPFVYWISDSFRGKFREQKLSELFDICNGISSGGNNERFYRYHWEVRKEDILNQNNQLSFKWATINKGGPYKKWYGNLWLVFFWEGNGNLLKQLKSQYPSIRYGYEQYYYKQGLAFSGVGKSLGVRYQPKYCIFERAGKSIFNKSNDNTDTYYYVLACLNSFICSYMIESLNPTESFQSGDVERIPIVIAKDSSFQNIVLHSKQNIEINKAICSFSIYEPTFSQSPINIENPPIISIKKYYTDENALYTQVLLNEAIINKIVFKIYELSDHDKHMVLDKEGVIIGDLPVSHEAKIAYKKWLQDESEFKASDAIISHLDNLDEQNDLPRINERIVNFESLYQNNNEWEEFCIKHKMNPVEVWWQFKNSNILPPQRTQVLAFELITDVVRSILAKDDDGVIPLNDKLGEERLSLRIEREMMERGYSAAQFNQVCQLLGCPLERYLQERFFQQLSDHLNLFMYLPKTPFIWHLSSGPHHAMELFISIYRWNRDTLFRIRSVYAANREASLRDQLHSLDTSSTEGRMEAKELQDMLHELQSYCAKIDDLLASGYNPILDDGVGKNIAPLQKRDMISYEVLKEKQLEKYLNADW